MNFIFLFSCIISFLIGFTLMDYLYYKKFGGNQPYIFYIKHFFKYIFKYIFKKFKKNKNKY